MSSTNATTADGFRVGRRVRVLPGYKNEGREGVLVPRINATDNEHFWHLQFGDEESDLVHLWHTSVLELLPDDAPATPEAAKHHLLDGLVARHVFEKKQQPAPAVAYDPREPETVASGKPHYYAKLRDAGCEPFAVIAACLPLAKAIAYHQATAIAYLIRAEHKHDSPDDDIRKAHAHLAEAVRLMDGRVA